MMKFKKILSVFLAGVTAVSLSAGTLTCYAQGTLYNQEVTKDTVNMYYIIGLEDDPIACYQQAKEIGVRDFVLSEEGKAVYEEIMAEHQQVKDGIAELIGRIPDVNYDYTAAFNGFSMALSNNEMNIINKNKELFGITYFEYGSLIDSYSVKAENKESDTDSSLSYADLTDKILEESGVTESGLDGDGIVIAVIDNEFDLKHEFLTMQEGVTGRLSKADVKAVYPYLSAAPYVSEKCYVSEKIPYAFDYSGYDFNTFSTNSSHGTHVAGIAAGNGSAETDPKYDPDGVASNAQLVLMSSETFTNSALMAAYDDVLYIGADVVNASYGSSYATIHAYNCGYTAIRNITAAGTIFCIAAGNSAKAPSVVDKFTDYSTGGQPNNTKGCLAIGSAENTVQKKDSSIIKLADGSEEVIVNSKEFPISKWLKDMVYEYVAIPGIGEVSDYANVDVNDKIALVQRGTIPFMDKINNAYDAGAAGIIVYNNNDSEPPFIMDVGDVAIPSGMVSYETGMKMIEAETKTVSFLGSVYTIEQSEDIIMSDYSSWAFTEQLLLSPDISGFGGDIVSSIAGGETLHKSYEIYSGTSMASPQLTGINALFKEYLLQNQEKYGITNRSDYTELSAKLLMSTATPVYTSDKLEIASPRVQGNGIANLSYAIKTPCYISTDSEKDNYRPKLSLGDGYKQSYDLVFNVTNISDTDCTYTPSVQLFKDTENEDGSLAWNTLRFAEYEDFTAVFSDEAGKKLEQINVPAGETVKITAKVNMSDEIFNLIKAEGGRFVDGFIRLNSAENPNLTLAFMAFCGDWSQADEGGLAYKFIYGDMINTDEGAGLVDYNNNSAGMNIIDQSITQPCFSPNGDNVFDSLGLYMMFKRRCYDLTVTIYNSEGKQVYTENLGDGYNNGSPIVGIYGKTYDIKWDFKENGEIKENAEYTMEISARLPLAEKMTVIDSCTFKIDNQAPVIKKVGKLTLGEFEYLVIEAEDNTAIQGAFNYSDIFEEILDQQSANTSVSGDKILVYISDNKPNDVIQIYDTAGNYTTVSPSDAAYTLSDETTEQFGYATTDEESFTDGKYKIVDKNDKEIEIDISFSASPLEIYETYGSEETEISIYVDGYYAFDMDVSVGLPGDANMDGEFNVRDAAYIAKMLANRASEEFMEFISSLGGYCADSDKNGEINVRDAAFAARQLAAKNS